MTTGGRTLLCFRGAAARSDFRLRRLLEAPEAAAVGLETLEAHYLYFALFYTPPSAEQRQQLIECLGGTTSGDAEEAEARAREDEFFFLVTPRAGTVSPWSSKARDILHNCGLYEILRLEQGVAWRGRCAANADCETLWPLLHDRMVETVHRGLAEAESLFTESAPRPLRHIPVLEGGKEALDAIDAELGLALSEAERAYLLQAFGELGREPTDAELMSFAQVNSEHCRHKIFNARWKRNGTLEPRSLFAMIRNTMDCSGAGVLSAYEDNAAVFEGNRALRFFPGVEGEYRSVREAAPLLIKAETHNHPTAIAPFPGAGTGIGGELRDEAAVGQGARFKMGLCGFSVSHLRIPGYPQPWEGAPRHPPHIASPLEIMLQGPIGGAAFGNEFGRPNLCGYFRSFEMERDGKHYGYHKPIMLAGGLGAVRPQHLRSRALPENSEVVVLGGPALMLGLGGGAASSLASGAERRELDFMSVQRQNPEMQRRCQEVIDRCCALGANSPIGLLHDVGAGGLANALSELAREVGGVRVELRALPSDDPAMSPLELLCNESQERFVLVLKPGGRAAFSRICDRECCPWAIIGKTGGDAFHVRDALFDQVPVDLPLSLLFDTPPIPARTLVETTVPAPGARSETGPDLRVAVERVLRFPAVAAKDFLVTITDRSVGGMVCRDQMVGPWQTAVADAALCCDDFTGFGGAAMAMGERSPLAVYDAPAAARMAVGEALTNLAGVEIGSLGEVRLSANWMAAAGDAREEENLFRAVHSLGMELCPPLKIAIPVGKDSLSMRTAWRQGDEECEVIAPLSVVISAFARVRELRTALTPQLLPAGGDLFLLDLGGGQDRLGGSCLAQVFGGEWGPPPDLDSAARLRGAWEAIQACVARGLLSACHDRSDGGLLVAALEMAFAGRCGLELELPADREVMPGLFSEELGLLLQVPAVHERAVRDHFITAGLGDWLQRIGGCTGENTVQIRHRGELLFRESRSVLQTWWRETSYRLQSLRDHPGCAAEEYAALADEEDPGLQWQPGFSPQAPALGGARPPLAILREQGVNGQYEMAAAFDRAGFRCIDVHTSELLYGKRHIRDFCGLAVCGGFSYGDVFGAGRGWAQTILAHERLREEFRDFFHDPGTFSFGVCNGCQMLSLLRELIPGSAGWPLFTGNRSEQFEARLVMVEVPDSSSVLLAGMAGARLPVPVAHAEGRVQFGAGDSLEELARSRRVALRYVDNRGAVTEHYPCNPNGSEGGLTGVSSADGRVTLMMPHPERAFRCLQFSWAPPAAEEESPWMQLFYNARRFVA